MSYFSIGQLEDTAHFSGDVGVMSLAVRNDILTALAGTDRDYAPLQINAFGALYVDNSGVTQPVSGIFWQATQPVSLTSVPSHNVTNAGIFVTQATLQNGTAVIGKLATNSGVDIGDVDVLTMVGSSIAHDVADSGKPHKIGNKAIDIGANPTEVAANDRTDAYANRAGIPFVQPGHPNVLTASLNVSDADGAQTDTAIITVGAGEAIVVLMCQVYVDEATTAGTQVRIGFGAINTPALDAAKVIMSRSGVPAGGGAVAGTGAGIVGQGASNEDLRVTCADPTGGNLDIIVTYYTIAI